MRNIFIIILTIIGALIGAGFASGQEIYSFFYSYGIYGVIGLICTCSLISILIYKILKIIIENDVDGYNEFLKLFIKKESVVKTVNSILNILLLITFYIMIAGFGAYFEQEIGVSKILGSLILAIMCFIVFLTNVKGVLKVSEFLVPILIIFIVILGIKNLQMIEIKTINIPILKTHWFISSVIYCSYNIILLIPVLISLRRYIYKKEDIKVISIMCGIILMILAIIIYFLLVRIDIEISTLEMPVVYVISRFYNNFRMIYAFIILASIFTTAISIGTGFLQNIAKNNRSYPQFVALMCISSLVVTNFGFSKLVNLIYPIFGYIGIIQIIFIIKKKSICKK